MNTVTTYPCSIKVETFRLNSAITQTIANWGLLPLFLLMECSLIITYQYSGGTGNYESCLKTFQPMLLLWNCFPSPTVWGLLPKWAKLLTIITIKFQTKSYITKLWLFSQEAILGSNTIIPDQQKSFFKIFKRSHPAFLTILSQTVWHHNLTEASGNPEVHSTDCYSSDFFVLIFVKPLWRSSICLRSILWILMNNFSNFLE